LFELLIKVRSLFALERHLMAYPQGFGTMAAMTCNGGLQQEFVAGEMASQLQLDSSDLDPFMSQTGH
jgi:hypothetical protein